VPLLPPARPSLPRVPEPNPLSPALYLLIPVLAPGLLLLDRVTGRRYLGGPRRGSAVPLASPARSALARRALARRAVGLQG
jgi:hypothetical protein